MIKLVKVKSEFYELCKNNEIDKELLHNEQGRPCVLLIKLRYQGRSYDFVVPLRSNISPTVPKSQYFALPPSSHTNHGRKHGVHYYKLFPVTRTYIDKFVTTDNAYYTTVLNILNRHESDIIKACQEYLQECEKGNKHYVTPNIDGIIDVLDFLKYKNDTAI